MPSPGSGASRSQVLDLHKARCLRQQHEFAEALFRNFEDLDSALDGFDVNRAGSPTMAEFLDGAGEIGFPGEAEHVFEQLDVHGKGRIGRAEFMELQVMHVSADATVKAFLRDGRLSVGRGHHPT